MLTGKDPDDIRFGQHHDGFRLTELDPELPFDLLDQCDVREESHVAMNSVSIIVGSLSTGISNTRAKIERSSGSRSDIDVGLSQFRGCSHSFERQDIDLAIWIARQIIPEEIYL